MFLVFGLRDDEAFQSHARSSYQFFVSTLPKENPPQDCKKSEKSLACAKQPVENITHW